MLISPAEKTRIAQALPDLVALLPQSKGVVANMRYNDQMCVIPMTPQDRSVNGELKVEVTFTPKSWQVRAIKPLSDVKFGTIGGKVEEGQSELDAVKTEAREELTDLTGDNTFIEALGELRITTAPAINLQVLQWTENGIARVRGAFELSMFYILLSREQFEILKPHGLTSAHNVPIQQQRSYLPYMMRTINI